MADSTDTGSTADSETEQGVIKNKFLNALIYNLRSSIKTMTIMVQALENAIHDHEKSISDSELETGQEDDKLDQTETEVEQNQDESTLAQTVGEQEEGQDQDEYLDEDDQDNYE